MTTVSKNEQDASKLKETSAEVVNDLATTSSKQVDQHELAKKAKKLKTRTATNGPISKLFVFALLVIPCLNWLIFYFYVNISSFVMAFQDIGGNWSLANFSQFWWELTDPKGTLGFGLINTFKYFITSTCITFPCTVIMCYFFFKRIWGYKAFRFIIYLPSIISALVTTVVFENMVKNNGPLGIILQQLGVALPEDGLLGSFRTATNTIVAYTMWVGLSTSMLIVSGAMARIPIDVLESARLDGVGGGGELIHIIVPLVWPTLATLLLLKVTGILSSSGPILLLSDSPTQQRTLTLSYWIFAKVWNRGSPSDTYYGLVAATGLCFTVVLIPLVYGFRALTKLIPSVEY